MKVRLRETYEVHRLEKGVAYPPWVDMAVRAGYLIIDGVEMPDTDPQIMYPERAITGDWVVYYEGDVDAIADEDFHKYYIEVPDSATRIGTGDPQLRLQGFLSNPVCHTCTTQNSCRAEAICHYTGSPLTNPDGSPRTDFP
jgi:hypothetical protein